MNSQSKKNPWYFYLIALLVPLLFFTLVELLLMAFGVGKQTPLFVHSTQFPGYSHVNPNIIERYFSNPRTAPDVRPDISLFKAQKPSTTFRIFIQGGSTAAGFPYGRWGSLQGMLNQRFKRVYPDKKIEIINTAMSAVNSYTLLDFVDEIIEQQADLVLIYAGHNEYLGIMGVGSRFAAVGSRPLTLLKLRLKRLRLYRVLEKALSPERSPQKSNDERSLMARIAEGNRIALASNQYRAGVAQLHDNLNEILSRYRKAGVPVLVGNLVSNIKDQAPLANLHKKNWQEYRHSLKRLNAEKRVATINALQSQLLQQPDADTHFELGVLFQQRSEPENAKKHFKLARDYDMLRFRAPSAFNTVIEKVAAEQGAQFVDVASAFEREARLNIVGDELMLEHLHPNQRGYFLLAETFFDKIVQLKLIKHPPRSYAKKLAWQDTPITEFEALKADYTVAQLKSDFPFAQNKQAVPFPSEDSILGKGLALRASGLDWLNFQYRMMEIYQKQNNIGEAAKIAANASDAMLANPSLAVLAAKLYLQAKDYALALYYYKRANELKPSDNKIALGLAQAYFFAGDEASSEQLLRRLDTQAARN